jgi:hypothetical protein
MRAARKKRARADKENTADRYFRCAPPQLSPWIVRRRRPDPLPPSHPPRPVSPCERARGRQGEREREREREREDSSPLRFPGGKEFSWTISIAADRSAKMRPGSTARSRLRGRWRGEGGGRGGGFDRAKALGRRCNPRSHASLSEPMD